MPRDVDERKTKRALRRLRAAKARFEAGLGPALSDWEEDFLQSLEDRLETYGSAFNDPEKGDREEPLSALQNQKVREIEKKSRGKDRPGGFRSRRPDARPSGRQLHDDIALPEPPASRPQAPSRQQARRPDPEASPASPEDRRRSFRVITGGSADTPEPDKG